MSLKNRFIKPIVDVPRISVLFTQESMVLATDEKLVFIDLETAGLETWRPIIQLAAIAVDSNLRELESLEMKIRFDTRKADPRSLNKQHYCPKLWKEVAVEPRSAAKDLAAFLRRHATLDCQAANGKTFQVAQLVAHNGNFDGPFLAAWYQRLGMFMPAAYRVFCTMQRALWLFHEDRSLTPPEDYKLLTLCQYFGVPLSPSDAHDAHNDVRATLGLYREFDRQSGISRRAGPPSQPERDLRLEDGLGDLRHGRTLGVDEALNRMRFDDGIASELTMQGARFTATAMATLENQFRQVKLNAAESAEAWLEYRQQSIEKLIVEAGQLTRATRNTEGHEIRELRLAGSQIRFQFTITDQGIVILCIASNSSAVSSLPVADTLPY